MWEEFLNRQRDWVQPARRDGAVGEQIADEGAIGSLASRIRIVNSELRYGAAKRVLGDRTALRKIRRTAHRRARRAQRGADRDRRREIALPVGRRGYSVDGIAYALRLPELLELKKKKDRL